MEFQTISQRLCSDGYISLDPTGFPLQVAMPDILPRVLSPEDLLNQCMWDLRTLEYWGSPHGSAAFRKKPNPNP